MLKRVRHGAAVLSVSSEFVKVMLFGGSKKKPRHHAISSTTILGFGKS